MWYVFWTWKGTLEVFWTEEWHRHTSVLERSPLLYDESQVKGEQGCKWRTESGQEALPSSRKEMMVPEIRKVDRFGGNGGYRIDRIWWMDIGNEREGRQEKDSRVYSQQFEKGYCSLVRKNTEGVLCLGVESRVQLWICWLWMSMRKRVRQSYACFRSC